ncbi:putative Nuclear migration protein nudC [Monoraphidium neglectum]|uniref:Putative Nuclear migration protein nudC n=1 Tax=Monoraphidium neglectum TaxID=145388 RepID=A0A0D2N9R6_9CHLO|nr:putative Nuclear migration protein nudC [Monoraphidium neglectum]KIZ02376.1 putative Nuclear migration protein nudC [Monoraphidium neglectum]|eukprot:XP_013901395.1 putative Nuclear migration protein nudC [Monoraphidium neglectum]
MTCVIKEVDENSFDADVFEKQLGLALIREHEGDAQKLLEAVLDFLKRKSNFFNQGDAKRRLLDAYRTVTGEVEHPSAGLKAGFLASTSGAAAKPAGVTTEQVVQQPGSSSSGAGAGPSPTQQEQQQDQAELEVQHDLNQQPQAGPAAEQAAAAAAPDTPAEATTAPSAPSPDVVGDEDEEGEGKPDQNKGLKPNAGRGADMECYSWTQTLSEVTVVVPVPPGTKGRSLDVLIAKQRLRVGVKGQPAIVDGKLSEAVKADDCLWNLVDNCVELTLTKAEGMHWWRSVLEGDAQIDTQQVEPENSKLEELDPETRKTVEKMMFDQRQKAMGLPTSDEMQKEDMLKRFMAAHPEMDFSNAKIQM